MCLTISLAYPSEEGEGLLFVHMKTIPASMRLGRGGDWESFPPAFSARSISLLLLYLLSILSDHLYDIPPTYPIYVPSVSILSIYLPFFIRL